jgi:hypothetical protein
MDTVERFESHLLHHIQNVSLYSLGVSMRRSSSQAQPSSVEQREHGRLSRWTLAVRCPIGVCQLEEVQWRESALKFGQALLLRKLNHGDVKLAGNESDSSPSGLREY